jgi:hypothetical protein
MTGVAGRQLKSLAHAQGLLLKNKITFYGIFSFVPDFGSLSENI